MSCKKGNDTALPLDINPPNVNTIDATADTINIFQNGTRQNNAGSIYPGGATGYLKFINGTQSISVKKGGSSNILFSKFFTINSNLYYSLFVTGTSTGDIFQTLDAIDTANAVLGRDLTSSTAMVRFVNASSTAGLLTVTVGTGDTVNFQNINYGSATPFTQFTATHAQEVKVFLPNSTKAAIDSVISFETGIIYTLYTRGSVTGTGNSALSLSLMNNPFIPKNQ